MTRAKHPQILTAYNLASGEILYLDQAGNWQPDIGAAWIFDEAERADTALGVEQGRIELVDPYLVEVSLETGRPVPVEFRERFRTEGISLDYLPPGGKSEDARHV